MLTGTQKYIDQLDDFIAQLKEDLLVHSKAASFTGAPSLKHLDEYILELNVFYYTSFHQKFFPIYRRVIEEDMRSLYELSLQEDTLKRDIVASIKQHARLYNKLKTTAAIMQTKRDEAKNFLIACYPGKEQRIVDLLYILKEIANEWIAFREQIQKYKTLLADKKLLAALEQYPAHVAAANLLIKWDPANNKAQRDLNRLMSSWQLAIKLLSKLPGNDPSTREAAQAVIIELQKIDAAWDNRKAPGALRSWYKQYIQKTFGFYTELISLQGDKNDFRRQSQIAGHFRDWLQSLLYILEQGLLLINHGERVLAADLYAFTRMDADYLQELTDYCSTILPSLDELINTLATSSQADYDLHRERSQKLLYEAICFCQLQINHKLKPQGILLGAKMERLYNKTTLLESRLELLDEKSAHYKETVSQFQLSFDMLDSCLNIINVIREEILKSLNHRNIKRSFPNINLRFNHIPLKIGQQFPADYLYLTNKSSFAFQLADAPPNQILYDEGDIFLINMDDLQEELIPSVILSKKG
ncbi:MAG: hypothetical protein PHF24_04595 [Syntrophomonas sp.]|nr:hypothetical protein [Syntrophomonas sp.]